MLRVLLTVKCQFKRLSKVDGQNLKIYQIEHSKGPFKFILCIKIHFFTVFTVFQIVSTGCKTMHVIGNHH